MYINKKTQVFRNQVNQVILLSRQMRSDGSEMKEW